MHHNNILYSLTKLLVFNQVFDCGTDCLKTGEIMFKKIYNINWYSQISVLYKPVLFMQL